MHPRVAAQEGRFFIFGRTQDLVDEKVRLEPRDDMSGIEELRLAQIRFEVSDVSSRSDKHDQIRCYAAGFD
jgi:hypothetical protein